MDIAIVGGGITGLSLALNLHKHGMCCRVFERTPEIRELGVGITLLPHAMREFAAFGLEDELVRAGVPIRESCFFNRFGQLIYREDRGRHAGYPFPELSIHRGRLHMILLRAAIDRLGADSIVLNRDCVTLDQDDAGVTLRLRETTSGAALDGVRADVAIACDGVNSALRRLFYPDDAVAFAGINTWRGITRRKPFLTGRSYTRTGSILTGKIVIYPIIDNVDGDGNQLINWMAEIKQDTFEKNDWNQPGDLADFFDLYRDWHFPWLDIPDLIRTADQILKYPMVDKDPVGRWTFGRVTLAGDAAHPMYPRGSNGAAQGAIDARALADCLAACHAAHGDPRAALRDYESRRLGPASQVVRTNRAHPPDFINIKVEELVGDRPFDDLDRYITQDELRALSENYKRVAGFSLPDVAAQSPGA